MRVEDETMELMTEDDARQRVQAMIVSRDWWVIPWLNEEAGDLSLEIEREYYRGEANADFVLITAPVPMSFARKHRMPERALAALMARLCSRYALTVKQWSEILKTQDVLITILDDGPGRREGWAAALAWHNWVIGACP
jgi:hypothetical protein